MFDEMTFRVFGAIAFIIGVPGLCLLGSYRRIKDPSHLGHWRNALGGAALLFVTYYWAWVVLMIAGLTTRHESLALDVLNVEAVAAGLLAPLMAIAWKGPARRYLMAAALLMLIAGQAFVYV